MHRALEIPAHIDLSTLSWFLYQQGIPHKISEESGKQVLWTPGPEQSAQVVQVYQDWTSGDLELEKAPPRRGAEVSRIVGNIPWRLLPVTMITVVICLLVALFSKLGENFQTLAYLTFVDFRIADGYIYFARLSHTLSTHEYWRLLTPVFIHFGFLHLAFNLMMFYSISGRIERHQGGLHLAGLVVLTGCLSNYAQYHFSDGSSLFGGMSGVIYGLLGYGMIRERIDETFHMALPPAIYGFMIFWLILGYTDLLGPVLGKMANAAHLGGLLVGMALGLVSGLFFKSRLQQ